MSLSGCWCAIEQTMNDAASPFPALSLSVVIQALRACVGRWGGRGLIGAALGLLLYRRLGEICRRMEGIEARFRTGRLWRLGARAERSGGTVVERAVRDRGERVWPLGFGWLVKAAAHEAAVFGVRLRIVLEQPEMVALLIAAPQAVRVLRPLCRMLAVEISLLRPGVEVVPPVVKVRVRKPRVPVDWGRIPLSRGVISWARREGGAKG
jgi:hypothetical protein